MRLTPAARLALPLVLLLLATPALLRAGDSGTDEAQMQAMQAAMAVGEHQKHLAVLEGTWAARVSMWMAPGGEPMVSEGNAHFKMLMGGRYLQQTFKGEFNGMPFEGMGLVAYDNVRKEYVSTWMDNMGTGIAIERGTCEGGKVFRSSGEYSDPVAGPVTMRSVHRIESPDRTVLEMFVQGPDGKEFRTMEIIYTRTC